MTTPHENATEIIRLLREEALHLDVTAPELPPVDPDATPPGPGLCTWPGPRAQDGRCRPRTG